MFYAETVGLATVLTRVKEYRARFGDYWQPAPLLVDGRRRTQLLRSRAAGRRPVIDIADARSFAGRLEEEVALSDWLEVRRIGINRFAEATRIDSGSTWTSRAPRLPRSGRHRTAS
jgi:hypothetical protein